MTHGEYLTGFKEKVGYRTIGREAEIPLVWERDCTSGNASLLWDHFRAPWEKFFDDTNPDFCVGVKNAESGWTITTDAGPGILEVISPPCQNLFEMKDGFDRVMAELVPISSTLGMRLLGYGAQPITKGAKELWVRKGRYGALIASLGDDFVHNATIVASDQCHVSITRDEIVQAVNVVNALSGPMIALTANCTVSYGGPNGQHAWRELFWDKFKGFEGQVGIPPKWFGSTEEWFEYLLSQRFVLRKVRDGVYESRGETFKEFMANNPVTRTDFLYHEGCCWWDARPRFPYGTLEVRPTCQQPPHETMVVQALTLGLVNNLPRAEELAKSRSLDSWRDIRIEAAIHGLDVRYGREATSYLPCIPAVLDIANEGLLSRGLGEEVLLDPLYVRLGTRTLPGDIALCEWKDGDYSGFFRYFAY